MVRRLVTAALAAATISLSAACAPPPTAPPAPTGPVPVQVSAGTFATCAVMSDGTVRCWGLPIGDLPETAGPPVAPQGVSVPTYVQGLTDIVQISVAETYACAVSTVGTVFCWGSNTYGQLGNGTTTASPVPVPVPGLPPATKVDTAGGDVLGAGHTCALLVTGGVRCWGYNHVGQLGDGTTTNSLVPVSVVDVEEATDIAVGGGHACAVVHLPSMPPLDRSVACWGSNILGQLGSSAGLTSEVPAVVTSDATDWVAIDASSYGTCASRGSGTATEVLCWGDGFDYSTYDPQLVPTPVAGLTQPRAAIGSPAGAGASACFAESLGAVRCLGWNMFGQLGDGSTLNSTSLVTVVGISNAESTAFGYLHACALLTNHVVKCWGNNTWGQLGDGATLTPAVFDPFAGGPIPAVNETTPVTVAL